MITKVRYFKQRRIKRAFFQDEIDKISIFALYDWLDKVAPPIRKLKARWSVELSQDLQGFYGNNYEDAMVQAVQEQLIYAEAQEAQAQAERVQRHIVHVNFVVI